MRQERKRSWPLAIDTIPTMTTESATPTDSAPETVTTHHNECSCKSPFVTPSHPLYIFGDVTPPNRKASKVEPARPQKANKCRESIGELSLPSLTEEFPSPFRTLCLSPTFAERERVFEGSQYETPRQSNEEPQMQHDRVIRKTTTFGMERIREMSIGSPLEQNLMMIEGDLEGEDGLATRLRRMKRRLFLENVAASASHEQTPKHSNRMNAAAMEGLEVVLEDHAPDISINPKEDDHNGLYLTFSASSSSSSLSVDIEQDDGPGGSEIEQETETSATAFRKQITMDCSVVTDATASFSTLFENDDTYWASLSSIAKNA